jgi:UDP-N-acetylglucosamine diphosphorylase / glucose-1-phosphate thymidylyltransferase / UDP-N-acetylgalactosamine diphosphorylase / glucosamine-1-phosphate N-acetyltransferase / galactosamine-1-phosphate N-acetyltransferase
MASRRLRSAVVLAAGQGSRIWPYGVVRQKAAFPIGNVPVVRRLAEDLAALGIERIVVVVGHGEASVRAALRPCRLPVEFVRQPQPIGNADAALLGAKLLQEDCLVVAGDVVTARANLAAMVEAWGAIDMPALALVQPLGHEQPQDWLVATIGDGLLRGVMGHPREGSYRLTGIYALSLDALDYLRDNPGIMQRVPVGGMPPLEAEIAQSLQMMIDEGKEVGVVEASGYLVDLDKPWHILEANGRLIDAKTQESFEQIIPASSKIHDGAEIDGRVVLGENCTIGNRVVVRGDLWLGDGAQVFNGAIIDGPAIIGPDTIVRDYCQIGGHTTLGARGIYGHGAEFEGVALDTVYCYHYCEIWGVVGEAVDFGAATVCGNLRFDDGKTTWRIKGRAETPTHAANAAYFGDFCRTGVNAIIMPGRRIGVHSVVGAGVVAYEDVPDRQMVMLKQELVTRPWGPERYGW